MAAAPPIARGEIPGHPAYPTDRVLVAGDPGPPGQRTAERLLHQVLGQRQVLGEGVELHHEPPAVGAVQLVEVVMARRAHGWDTLQGPRWLPDLQLRGPTTRPARPPNLTDDRLSRGGGVQDR